jgi:hypothetical protein
VGPRGLWEVESRREKLWTSTSASVKTVLPTPISNVGDVSKKILEDRALWS